MVYCISQTYSYFLLLLFIFRYLHRIGRTGRFGRRGTAINLVDDERSLQVLADIEKYYAKGEKEMIAQADADAETLAEIVEI